MLSSPPPLNEAQVREKPRRKWYMRGASESEAQVRKNARRKWESCPFPSSFSKSPRCCHVKVAKNTHTFQEPQRRLPRISGGGTNPSTPPKFNIAPEKWWLEDSIPFGMAYFQNYAKLPGSKWNMLVKLDRFSKL